MGNKMFMYAAVRGLAEKFGALVAVPADIPLLKSFRLSAFVIGSEQYASLLKLNKKRFCTEFVSLILHRIVTFYTSKKENGFRTTALSGLVATSCYSNILQDT